MNAFIVIYCLQSFLNLPFHLKYPYFCHITKYYDIWVLVFFLDFPCGSDGKASAYNVGDPGSIPGLRRSSGEGNSNPLQYSCLDNPMDGGVL